MGGKRKVKEREEEAGKSEGPCTAEKRKLGETLVKMLRVNAIAHSHDSYYLDQVLKMSKSDYVLWLLSNFPKYGTNEDFTEFASVYLGNHRRPMEVSNVYNSQ